MTAIAKVDEDGRIVIPEELLAVLHLTPGSDLVLREENGAIVVRPQGLYWENGFPVYETGPLAWGHADWLQQAREERADELAGK